MSQSSRQELRRWFARVDSRFMGHPIDIDPNDAILWAMRIEAGEVAYCEAQITRLSEDELFEIPVQEELVELPSGRVEYITVKRGVEQMNRWVTWRDHAVERMARFAKMAIDVGIEQRQIELAEQQARELVVVITAILTDLGHDLRDMKTRDIVRKRLMEGAIDVDPAHVRAVA